MNAPSVDIVGKLQESDVGLVLGTDLFISKEPDTPDNVVTIYDTPGGNPMLSMGIERYDYPSIQIRIRDNDYRTGYTLGKLIMDTLHGMSHETINGTYYSVVIASGDPFLLKYDENRRAIIIINFNLQRR